MTEVTEAPEAPAVAEPVLIESGRYKLWQTPDGSPAVARATGICERCESCGCGEQQALLTMASMIQAAMANGISLGKITGTFSGMFRKGRNRAA